MTGNALARSHRARVDFPDAIDARITALMATS
jgi:hypothetical protein